MLLVDSETPIEGINQPPGADFKPWVHLKSNPEKWEKPDKATDADCHLMVQCMENWLIADWSALSEYYKKGFKENLKPSTPIEVITKNAAYELLQKATKECKNEGYKKGSDSFKLLAIISANKVTKASPWAKRFIEEITKRKSAP